MFKGAVTQYDFLSDFQAILVCGTDKSHGQVFTQSDFPFNLDTIVNFFYRSHNIILIRLSDGYRTPNRF